MTLEMLENGRFVYEKLPKPFHSYLRMLEIWGAYHLIRLKNWRVNIRGLKLTLWSKNLP